MSRRWTVAAWIAALTLLFPTVCAAQVYGGVAFGGGGASAPFGSNLGGIRGTLRLFGGYEFDRYIAAEAMTLDLGTIGNQSSATSSTIGAFGVAAVVTLPVQPWRVSGRFGVLSMDGRLSDSSFSRTGQPLAGVTIGFNVVRGLTVGLETAVSRAEFPAPVTGTSRVNWTAAVASYRF
jgi:hypothetical protein